LDNIQFKFFGKDFSVRIVHVKINYR